MKFFNKRAATAMLLAVSMMATCVSPVFAEGTMEFNVIPDGKEVGTFEKNTSIYRPYFEWRERGQFGMASKNVMHVYAKAGETIYFGSDITEANDKSIEAILHSNVSFGHSLNSWDKEWHGASIAVTLPVEPGNETEAYVPIDLDATPAPDGTAVAALPADTEIEDLFESGSELLSNTTPDRKKIYLFKPTPNGAGHIATPEMEKNGPNGVIAKGKDTPTTDGYDPLSFVAPYDGTYSFRFLSRTYASSDLRMDYGIPAESREMISIDFQDPSGDVARGNISSNTKYYESGLGYVELYPHAANGGGYNSQIVPVPNTTNAPSSDYSGEVAYYQDNDVYFQMNNAHATRGCIAFTPLHDNAELEIVWELTESCYRELYVSQNGQEEKLSITAGPGLNVWKVSSIKGNPIEAGSEVKVYIKVFGDKNPGPTWLTRVHEIRYYYDRTTVDSNPVPTISPEPTPEPTPTPTPTPVPTPLVYASETINLANIMNTEAGAIYDKATGDTIHTGELYDLTVYNDLTKANQMYYYGQGDRLFGCWEEAIFNSETLGTVGDTSNAVLAITPKHDKAVLNITWTSGGTSTANLNYQTLDSRIKGTATSRNNIVTTTISGLKANEPVYLYITGNQKQGWFKNIEYSIVDECPFEPVNEPADWNSIAVGKYYTPNNQKEGDIVWRPQDITLKDPLIGELTLYASSGEYGYEIVEIGTEETFEDKTYPVGHKKIYLSKEGALDTSDLENRTGSVVAFKPKHDDASIEIVWKTDSRTKDVNLKINDGSERVLDTIGKNNEAMSSVKVTGLKKDEPIYLWTDTWNAMIYEIRYSYPGSMLTKSIDFGSVSTHLKDGIDTTVSDPVIGEFKLYANDTAGYVTAYMGLDSLAIGEKVYYKNHKRVSLPDFDQVTVYAENGDHEANSGGVMSLTPNHDGSAIDIYWRVDPKTQGTVNLKKNNVNFDSVDASVAAAAKATRIKDLKKGETVYISFDTDYAQIYEIEYSYPAAAAGNTSGGVEAASFFAEVSDILPISETYTYWFDEFLTAGTQDGELFAKDHFYALEGGNTWSTTKGKHGEHYNCLNVKPKSRMIQFAVADAAEITVYTQGYGQSDSAPNGRGAVVTSAEPEKEYMSQEEASDDPALIAVQEAGKTELTFTVDGATDLFLSSYGGDLYIAGVSVKMLSPEPEVPAGVTLKPVAEAYTWDFNDMAGNDGQTKYEENMLVGTHPLDENGKDIDSSYYYDLMALQGVSINNGSLWLYDASEMDGSIPTNNALEMIPQWNGTVEAVFKGGKVAITQGGDPVIGESSGELQSISLNVTAGEPVYIYKTDEHPYLAAVKYTPENLGRLKRLVNEQWEYSGSLISAWDITVAKEDDGSRTWDFGTWEDGEYSGEVNGLTLSKAMELEDNTKSWDGLVYTKRLKLTNGTVEFIPAVSGTLKIVGASADSGEIRDMVVYQGDVEKGRIKNVGNINSLEVSDIEAKVPVVIRGKKINEAGEEENTGINLYAIHFTAGQEGTSSVSTTHKEVEGRVWTDIFFLNAGDFQTSIYPHFKVLTRDGFLYDVNLNGIQPWAFVFYSNNRGFLLDPWSLYSNPALSDQKEPTMARLQALEHSFYSYSSASDVGPAPIRIEKDGNNNPIVYENGNTMQSTIDGNYIPVDKVRDETHKIFFNQPDAEALNVYTTSHGIREISTENGLYEDILNDLVYEGLGNAEGLIEVDVNGERQMVEHGTVGIGGRFMLTISEKQAKQLAALGSNSVSILLDFSEYELDEDPNLEVPNVPDIDTETGKWKRIAPEKLNNRSEAELNNLVSLSAVIDTSATGPKEYIISWDGRDAYGNVVPPGVYSDGVKSFIEMGMAHFPFLDAEHNPFGIKVKMQNETDKGEEVALADNIYYNNEAVSPRTNEKDPSAWYYTGRTNNADYPHQIGDGKNRVAGITTNFEDATADGGMIYGTYDKGEYIYGSAAGYGDSTAIDMWAKYEHESNAQIIIGVADIIDHRPYVSFVATEGKVPDATDDNLPFKVSHVGYSGQVLEEYEENRGESNIYGNTISTGFVTTLTPVGGPTQNYVIWDITIPASTEINKIDNGTTSKVIAPTFIKIPEADMAELAAQKENAEYLTYELYSGLFDDYAIGSDDSGVDVGEEFAPDWEAGASFDTTGDMGMVDIPDNAVKAENGWGEESYVEAMSLLDEEGKAYNNGGAWGVSFNLDSTPTLFDAPDVQVNNGDIYKITAIDGDETAKANIKLRYKLPTTVTGTGKIAIGLVIDNLYSPGAMARVQYGTSYTEHHHDITSILYKEDIGGTNQDSVQATTYNGYAKNPYNDYYTFNESKPAESIVWTMATDFAGEENKTVNGLKFHGTAGNSEIKNFFDYAVIKIEGGSFNDDGTAKEDVFEYLPTTNGTIKVQALKDASQQERSINIKQGDKEPLKKEVQHKVLTDFEFDVVAGIPVYIYSSTDVEGMSAGIYFYTITFTPNA